MSETTIANKITEGTILEGDFGYSMSLPAFFVVTKVTASGKSAYVKRLATENTTSDGGWTGTCVPVIDKFHRNDNTDKLYRIKSARWRGNDPCEYVMIRDHIFQIWDGEPAYFDHWD